MLRLSELNDVLVGECKFSYNEREYDTVNDVKSSAANPERLIVKKISSVCNNLIICVVDYPVSSTCVDPEWEKEYISQFGTAPSFF